MTPERLKALRAARHWSQKDLAGHLRLGVNGKRTVARWEAGGAIPGPASVAIEALEDGWSPGGGKWRSDREDFSQFLDRISQCVTQAKSLLNRNERDEFSSD